MVYWTLRQAHQKKVDLTETRDGSRQVNSIVNGILEVLYSPDGDPNPIVCCGPSIRIRQLQYWISISYGMALRRISRTLRFYDHGSWYVICKTALR